MTLSELRRLFSPAHWLFVAAGLVACLLVIATIIWFATEPGRQKARAEQARAAAALAGARTASAANAAQITDQAASAAISSETLSKETANAIAQAPGAGQRLDPGLNDAGRRRLCLRPAYAGTPDCLQLLGRAEPAG